MSEDEKNAQIGVAVAEYQKAKVDVAHIDKKIHDVLGMYRTLGSIAESHSDTSYSLTLDEEGALHARHVPVNASLLLNAADLSALVKERDQAKALLAAAKKMMSSLGLTDIS